MQLCSADISVETMPSRHTISYAAICYTCDVDLPATLTAAMLEVYYYCCSVASWTYTYACKLFVCAELYQSNLTVLASSFSDYRILSCSGVYLQHGGVVVCSV